MNANILYHFTLLRHGESVGNAERRFQGQADFPLTDLGQAQARRLAKKWHADGTTFDRVISSPLLRARQTAEIICNQLKIPIDFDPDLMEVDNGIIAGLNSEEASGVMTPPALFNNYTHYGKSGESRWELYLRAGRVVQKLVDSPPGKTLVVSHGGILNMVVCALLGIPLMADPSGARFMFGNTGHATFSFDPERRIWRLLGFDGAGNAPE